MKLAFYGSSLLSSYWNGAATYYRGLLRELATLGYEITFFEPDAFDRQAHRDIDTPDWCEVVVYAATPEALARVTERAAGYDIVVKASGVGYADDLLARLAFDHARPDAIRIFWDVDAPATLAEIEQSAQHPMRPILKRIDAVFTYGGGDAVIAAYRALGAQCTPIYNALDPETHHPAPHDERFVCDLAFLGNRLPDRETRVEEFFLKPALRLPNKRFILGGAGWGDKNLPANVHWLNHVPTRDHNALNSTAMAVLNINRDSMAATGFSPPTRVFEAAGAGACLITDEWAGLDAFLEPDEEVLVACNGDDVVALLEKLEPQRAVEIGQSALTRVLRDHTYRQRAGVAHAALTHLRRRKGLAA